MGRKRLFCQHQTLRQILCLFWQKGYAHTSMRDIARALDIPIASLYHCYGDKESLLLAALAAYHDDYLIPAINALETNPDPRAALEGFFAAPPATPPPQTDQTECPAGCFLVLMADQCQTEAPHLAERACAMIVQLEQTLTGVVQRLSQNSLAANAANAHARCLIGHMIALKTMARMANSQQMQDDYRQLAIMPLIRSICAPPP